MAAQGISFVSMPLLSRLFLPDDFGLLALFTAVSAITASFVSLSYPIRVVLPDNEEEAQGLLFLSIAVSAVLGALVVSVSMLLPSIAVDWLGLQPLGKWLQAALVAGILNAIITSFIYWLNRNSLYRQITSIRVLTAAAVSGCAVIFGVARVDNGLLYAQIIAVVTAAGILFCSTPTFTNVSVGQMFSLARVHKSAPIHLLPTALMDTVSSQLPVILLVAWFGDSTAGQYRMAYTCLSLPLTLVGLSVGQVFYQKFTTTWPDAVKAKKLVRKTLVSLAVVGGPLLLVVGFFGKTLFTFWLGPAWETAGQMASILAVMTFVSLLHSPISPALIVMGYDRMMPFFALAALAHRSLALYVGYYVGDVMLALKIYVLFEVIHMMIFQLLIMNRIDAVINTKVNQ